MASLATVRVDDDVLLINDCVYARIHASGGIDVVDLPDILLPDGQCLIMFDSDSVITPVICLMINWLKFPRWIHGWVFLSPTESVVWIPLCLDPSNGVFDVESDCTGFSLIIGLLGYCCWLVAGVDSIVFESIRLCAGPMALIAMAYHEM